VAHRAPPHDHHRPPAVLLPSRRSASRRRGFCAAPVACSPSAEHPATSRHGATDHQAQAVRVLSGSCVKRSSVAIIQRATAINGDRVRGTNHWSSRAEHSLWERQRGGRRRPGQRASPPRVRGVGAAPVTTPAPREFPRNPLLPPARGRLSLLGMPRLSPKPRALCAKEITLQLAARIPRSLCDRRELRISNPSIERVLWLAACQLQCTTNLWGHALRSDSIADASMASNLLASNTIKLLYLGCSSGQQPLANPGARRFGTASCRAWWTRARGGGRCDCASAVRWGADMCPVSGVGI